MRKRDLEKMRNQIEYIVRWFGLVRLAGCKAPQAEQPDNRTLFMSFLTSTVIRRWNLGQEGFREKVNFGMTWCIPRLK